MKYIIIIILALVSLQSCFSTKAQEEAESKKRELAEQLHKDSIKVKLSTPDTTLASYKRTMFCDGNQVITYDRVTLISGPEAIEYAQRHNRYNSSENVVINKEVYLETLPVSNDATILLMRPDEESSDSIPPLKLQKCYIDDINDIGYDKILKIIILQKCIIYLEEMDLNID